MASTSSSLDALLMSAVGIWSWMYRSIAEQSIFSLYLVLVLLKLAVLSLSIRSSASPPPPYTVTRPPPPPPAVLGTLASATPTLQKAPEPSNHRRQAHVEPFGARQGRSASSTVPYIAPKAACTTSTSRVVACGPHALGLLCALIHALILASSLVVVGILAHSIGKYHPTKSITFPSTDGMFPIWPDGLNPGPTGFLLGVAITGALTSAVRIYHSIRTVSGPLPARDRLAVGTAGFMSVAWVVALVVFQAYDNADKKNLAWAACNATHIFFGPSGVVDVHMLCAEQMSALYIGCATAVAEVMILVTLGWCYVPRVLGLLRIPTVIGVRT